MKGRKDNTDDRKRQRQRKRPKTLWTDKDIITLCVALIIIFRVVLTSSDNLVFRILISRLLAPSAVTASHNSAVYQGKAH